MEEARQKNSQDPLKNSRNVGRMEEARQKNSQDSLKTLEMLEEWKKLWEKEIIQSCKKYFLSFSTKYWKNGRS